MHNINSPQQYNMDYISIAQSAVRCVPPALTTSTSDRHAVRAARRHRAVTTRKSKNSISMTIYGADT